MNSSAFKGLTSTSAFKGPQPIEVYNNKSIYLKFSIDGDKIKIYNSYKIKDTLKAHGFRFDPSDKSWYATKMQLVSVANHIWSYLPVDIKKYCYLHGVKNAETEQYEKVVKPDDILRSTIKQREVELDKLVNDVVAQVSVLKRYQIEAIRLILKRYLEGAKGFILEDEQGLGKTLQAAAVIYALLTSGKASNAIIFTKNSLVQNYINEFIKFFSETGFMVLVSDKVQPGKVVVTSYSRIRTNDYDLIKSLKHDIVVFR